MVNDIWIWTHDHRKWWIGVKRTEDRRREGAQRVVVERIRHHNHRSHHSREVLVRSLVRSLVHNLVRIAVENVCICEDEGDKNREPGKPYLRAIWFLKAWANRGIEGESRREEDGGVVTAGNQDI